MCGVSQGSILFIIYMNDSHLCAILYAGYNSVLVNDKNLNNFVEILHDELNKLSTSNLSSNVNKTRYIIFHGSRIKLPGDSINKCINNLHKHELNAVKTLV